jgi:hypothetical protein
MLKVNNDGAGAGEYDFMESFSCMQFGKTEEESSEKDLGHRILLLYIAS